MSPWAIRPLPEALVLLALVVLSSYGLAAFVRRTYMRARLRTRMRRARKGERRAERLLEGLGYRVEARQASLVWHPEVDGEPYEIEVRADLIVSRAGRRYVAEVKTGAVAPDVRHAPTRRQLLEYQHAYRTDGVLLVAPEAGTVREVLFPGTRARDRSLGVGFVGFVAGAALGAGVALTLLAG